ncbi:MAG: GNAT family N-acetyltransferase [Planctomycetes bacterium]|nr:GNAT family N-acetyltransferase [Planctomycetota bacterium]
MGSFNNCTRSANLLGGGIVYFYQAGIDPDQLAEQPGHVLTAARIERVIQRGYSAVDFLRGDEPYKAQWGAQPRSLMTLRIVRRRPVAQLRHQAWILGCGARRLARQGITSAEQFSRKWKKLRDDVVARARHRTTPSDSTAPKN